MKVILEAEGKEINRGSNKQSTSIWYLKRARKVYTQVIKNDSSSELLPIIRNIINKKSAIYTDKWKAYDSVVLDGHRHKRINHSNYRKENLYKKLLEVLRLSIKS